MASEKMSEVEQTTMLLALQKEIVEMKKKNEKVIRRNEEEITALKKENEEMKEIMEGGPLVESTNLVGRSFTTPVGPKTVEEPKKDSHSRDGW